MKLILASDNSFLIKYGYDQIGISKSDMKIGYIITASKGARTNANFLYRQQIKDAGYDIHEFDIENKSKDEILNFFEDKNIIQVEGGNSFYLLNAIRNSGYSDALIELFKRKIVYIGVSAGTYVMCPSIEVSDWSDDTVNRFDVNDFTALNYIPFVLKVHYVDDQEEFVCEKMKTLKYPLRILRDGQGIIVENGKYAFMGDGEEVILN
jgi:dipeptidase E